MDMTTDQKLAQIAHNVMLRVNIRAAQIHAELDSMAERDRRGIGQKFRWLLSAYR